MAGFFEILGKAQQLGSGDFGGFAQGLRQDQQRRQQAKMGEDLVNQIALKSSADQKSAEVQIPQEHLALLQGVQSQGPEQVRAMSNFLAKNQNNAELQAQLPELLNTYQAQGLLQPGEVKLLNTRLKTDPEATFSQAMSIANQARTQTGQAINAKQQLLGQQQQEIKASPQFALESVRETAIEKASKLKPEQIDSLDLEDPSTYRGLMKPEEAAVIIQQREGKTLDPNFIQGFLGSKPISTEEFIKEAKQQPLPLKSQVQALEKEKQDLSSQKLGIQFRGQKPGEDLVPITLDGQPKKIPRANLKQAQKVYGKRLQLRQ